LCEGEVFVRHRFERVDGERVWRVARGPDNAKTVQR
jgi:hypothetical protein